MTKVGLKDKHKEYFMGHNYYYLYRFKICKEEKMFQSKPFLFILHRNIFSYGLTSDLPGEYPGFLYSLFMCQDEDENKTENQSFRSF